MQYAASKSALVVDLSQKGLCLQLQFNVVRINLELLLFLILAMSGGQTEAALYENASTTLVEKAFSDTAFSKNLGLFLEQ